MPGGRLIGLMLSISYGGILTVANSTLTANGYAFESNVAMNGDTVIVANNT